MKRTNIQILTLLLSAAAMAACSKDLTETSKGETPLELTVSQNEIVLDERNYSSTGISLEWTTGTNYGTGNAIDYTLEIAPEQSDYADGITVELNDSTSLRRTVKALLLSGGNLRRGFGTRYLR